MEKIDLDDIDNDDDNYDNEKPILFKSLQTLSDIAIDNENEQQIEDKKNNFSLFHFEKDRISLLSFCLIIKDNQNQIENTENPLKIDLESQIKYVSNSNIKKFNPNICEKKVKIYELVFFSSNDNHNINLEKIQFQKYLSTFIYVPLNPSLYYSKCKYNAEYINNESFFKSFQIAIASFLLEIKIRNYLINDLNLDLGTSIDKDNENGGNKNLDKMLYMLIDRVHLNEFRKEVLTLISESPLRMELIVDNPHYKCLFYYLPLLLSKLDQYNNEKHSFYISDFHAPLSSDMVNLSSDNSIFIFPELIIVINNIIKKFKLFPKNKIILLSFKNAIYETELEEKCFYFSAKKKEVKESLLFIESTLINHDSLSLFFDIRGNRGFIGKIKNDYFLFIGETEKSELIGVNLDNQNGSIEYNFLNKFSVPDYNWEENFGVNYNNIFTCDKNILENEVIFLLSFKTISEYNALIIDLEQHIQKKDKLFHFCKISEGVPFVPNYNFNIIDNNINLNEIMDDKNNNIYQGMQVNLLTDESEDSKSINDNKFSIIDLNESA